MESDARMKLVAELEDLVTVRLVMVLVPALEALGARGDEEFAQFLGQFAIDLKDNLEWLVSRYEIHLKENDDEPKHV